MHQKSTQRSASHDPIIAQLHEVVPRSTTIFDDVRAGCRGAAELAYLNVATTRQRLYGSGPCPCDVPLHLSIDRSPIIEVNKDAELQWSERQFMSCAHTDPRGLSPQHIKLSRMRPDNIVIATAK